MKTLFFLPVFLLASCSGSGPDGRWTPADTAAAVGTINAGVDTYNRITNPHYFYQPSAVIVP
jgi:hypothetical protein